MTSNQWTQIESLFHAAVKLPAAERIVFLTEACAGDDELRHEVEALLAADNSRESATAILSPQVIADGLAHVHAERFTGKLIHHYQVISQLGAGGMGEVFLAEDARLQRKVALKLLPANYTNDRERVRRFEQEARAASALNHPNIITIHDLGESDSGCFIVMEHVAGRTLRALATENIALTSLLDWGSQVAKALSAAHAANIIHRDIKPDNIMVRDDGYVKVLDFGLARLNTAHDEFSNAMTMPGTVMGTVRYMSPEQTRGEIVTTASDIFAFGIVLYELATGQHPFNGASLLAVMQAITSQMPVTPAQLNPTLPAELNVLLLRMLAKDATVRPSAVEIASALEDIGRSGEATHHSALKTHHFSLRHTVGRETERAELRAAFRSGRGSLLCVAGEPGIGKTTLVEDFLTELSAQQSCTIARGRCSERLAGTEAYLPLLEALESLLVQSTAFRRNPGDAKIPPEGGTLNSLMRQLAPTWYAQVASLNSDDPEAQKLLAEVKAASQERMKRELATFLNAVAHAQPLVIFFDDLHWADVSTIDLLSFLAGKFDTMQVLMIVTYRPSDMLLAKHPFLQIKPDLQARGVCRELLLEFLNEAEIAEYLALEFPGHRFPAEFPKLIHAKTEGSPLFMADLVRYLRDRNVIANKSGAWKLEQTLPDIERELPESVRGMIERKIAQLEPDDHKLLTAASVQGYEFDSAVVAQVLGIDADEIEERLEKLERVFAFVKLTSEAEFPNRTLTLKYRFVHVLYQNTLYGALRVTRKASLSAAVAHSLQEFYGVQSNSIAVELANLFEAARDFAKATEYFTQAARGAVQINAHREAVDLFRRGLASLHKLPEMPVRDQQEIGLQLVLGVSLQSVQGWGAAEVEEAFSQAHKLCQQFGNDPNLFAALFGIAVFKTVRVEYAMARQLMDQTLELAAHSDNSILLTMAYFGSAIIHVLHGELLAGTEQFERAISFYQPEAHKSYLAFFNEDVGMSARRGWGQGLWYCGYPEQALQRNLEAMELAEHFAHPATRGGAHQGLSVIHFFRREFFACQKQTEALFALAQEYDQGSILLYGAMYRAMATAYQGQLEEGLQLILQVIDDAKTSGSLMSLSSFLMVVAELLGLAKQPETGLDKIAEAFAFIENTGEHFFEAEAWRIKGGLLLLTQQPNREAEAESCFQQAIEIAQQQSAKSWELRAATSLARLWQQQGKTTEARQMLAEIYGWFTEGFDTADLQDAKALLDELSESDKLQFVAAAKPDTLATIDENPKKIVTAEAGLLMTTDDKLKFVGHSPSIAVLPFVNISNDPDNEYFCDGLAEELLNALSKIEALHVAARTSSFSFKGKETDIREIGQKLNVGAVLEGSVRKSGNRLRITAQLINIADGYHLWSERYDREMKDIFDIQDEISLAIVDALKVKLLGAEKAAVTKRYTDNTEAYELYLLGQFHFGKATDEGFTKAIAYYEQAVAMEPDYVLALAGLAEVWLNLWYWGYISPEESLPQTQAAYARVLEVDPTQAESHIGSAQLKFYYERDFAGGVQEFKQAIALNPNQADAHSEYGLILSVLGRTAEADAEAKRSMELDPLSLLSYYRAGYSYWALRDSDRVFECSRKLIELEPNFFGGYSLAGAELWTLGKYEQALAQIQTAAAFGELRDICYLGCLYGITGEPEKARQVLEQLQEFSQTRHVLALYSALIYAALGEMDRAFEGLEKSYEQREATLVYLKYIVPLIPGLKDDPRLADLLRRIGLPE